MAVVVLDVAVEDAKEVAAAGDQEMVQAFPAQGADPALGDGVGVRRLDRCADDLGAEPVPDVIEGSGELAVAVAEQEPEVLASSSSVTARLRACWVTHAPGGLAVTPARWTRRVCSWMKNSTYSRCRNTVSTVRKSQATMPAACRRRNDRHVVEASRGAGWSPLARRTLAMEACRDLAAKAQQLPADALVAPAWILGGQPHDQGLHLLGNRWPAAPRRRIGPAPAHHAPVPSQQRLGRDHEDRPSRHGQETAEGRKQRAVFGLEPRPWVLAAQDCQLVA
jgi:hypothetical protein